MISRTLISLLTSAVILVAAETVLVPTPSIPVTSPASLVATGRPWLGVQLSKADPTTSAHIPALPQGIGFLIKSIDPGGPGEASKLQPFDILWKLGDQMLANEAQLATLLRLSKPGDEVKLAIFRGGQHLEVRLKLGDLPAGKDGFSNNLAEAAILPSDGSPMRVVTFAERTATYSTEEGRAVLRRDGESYLLVITDSKNAVLFKGDVSDKEKLAGVPEGWQRRVWSLKRGLDHTPQDLTVPVRPPRPRVVTPPPPKS